MKRNNEQLFAVGIFIVFMVFIILFLFSDRLLETSFFNSIPEILFNFNTIFLSIILETLPFILIGVFASAVIQSFSPEKWMSKMLPANAFIAMIPATMLGIIFPICECAIIPVVRRLISKGLPQHVGIVMMLTIPILNPVVYLSTYYAFHNQPNIIFGRMILAFLTAILIGTFIHLFYKKRSILRQGFAQVDHSHSSLSKWSETFGHACEEFFSIAKYLIFGAICASLFQTFLDRELLVSLGTDVAVAPVAMMGFAYVLSLCSSADAFVASSFNGMFTSGSILAFLVFGPMLDIKNTLVLLAYFRAKFVFFLIVITFIIVYGLSILYQILT